MSLDDVKQCIHVHVRVCACAQEEGMLALILAAKNTIHNQVVIAVSDQLKLVS